MKYAVTNFQSASFIIEINFVSKTGFNCIKKDYRDIKMGKERENLITNTSL